MEDDVREEADARNTMLAWAAEPRQPDNNLNTQHLSFEKIKFSVIESNLLHLLSDKSMCLYFNEGSPQQS